MEAGDDGDAAAGSEGSEEASVPIGSLLVGDDADVEDTGVGAAPEGRLWDTISGAHNDE